jgi:site-specific DNA-methyltransferase (adenine-specific)
MGKDWDRLSDFKAPASSGEWAKNNGAVRKGFDGYSPLPTYTLAGNVKCPDCGNWRDGRDPKKADKRKGYRCVCGGAQLENRRLVNARIQAWHREWLLECNRVLRPGGIVKAFSGTRTFHRLAAAMEDAGFAQVRLEAWTYGSGFPKSMNVSKAFDKAAGKLAHEGKNMRDVTEGVMALRPTTDAREYVPPDPVTDEAVTWKGWGTALKPAWEPVVVGVKP